MPLPLSGQVLDAFEAVLQAVADTHTGGRLAREPEGALDYDQLPEIVMFDGEARLIEDGSDTGGDLWQQEILVSPLVAASPLHEAYHELAGRVIESAMADETLGGLAYQITPVQIDPLEIAGDDGDAGQPFAFAAITFLVSFFTAPNDPFTAA